MEDASPSAPATRGWLKVLFDESPLAIGFSRDGVMLDANRAYVRLFGYERADELIGHSLIEQIAPAHHAEVLERIAQRAQGDRQPERYQTVGRRRDGTEFPFEVTSNRVLVGDEPVTIAFIVDVSERVQALEALKASEERFRTLSGASFEGVFVHADGKIVLANEAGAAMYGFTPESMVGASVMELTAPESRERVAEAVRRAASEPYEGVARRRDGSTFPAELRARTLVHQTVPMRVAVIRDITERKRIEAEQRALSDRMQQTQKLESLGVLAGGVAHDFNNILTIISNGVALAKREPDPAQRTAHFDAIALAAERAADLCRQMLAYAGKAQLERNTVELGALVSEMSSMLEAAISKKATLVRDFAPGLPTLLGDATQLRQIVMNLVLNAAEAIDGPRGTILIATGSGRYEASDFARSVAGGELGPGEYVWFEVTDNGVGMEPSTMAQMFDPFFTTKFVGRGLGMAAVLGIVRGHHGAIGVDSRPGQGTRIRTYFPAHASSAPARVAEPTPSTGGRGLVLLVDDETNVRTSTAMLLQGLGFEVLAAASGAEAIALARTHGTRLDAVLLDLTMPQMDGLATMKALRQIVPAVPVVLTTGYGTVTVQPGDSPDAVLPKPYAADKLLATLQGVMLNSTTRKR